MNARIRFIALAKEIATRIQERDDWLNIAELTGQLCDIAREFRPDSLLEPFRIELIHRHIDPPKRIFPFELPEKVHWAFVCHSCDPITGRGSSEMLCGAGADGRFEHEYTIDDALTAIIRWVRFVEVNRDESSPDDPEKQADQADRKKLFPKGVPDDTDLTDAILRLDAERSPGNTDSDILRNFTGETVDDCPKAKKLAGRIRKARRDGRTTLPGRR